MASDTKVTVSPAEFPQDRGSVAALFAAYAKSLGIDLTFQSFDEEVASLPGKYASTSGGALFLARATSPETNSASGEEITKSNDIIIGCVAMRALQPPHSCELKRLYIIPQGRGCGAGKLLLESAIAKARELGYKEMFLDTLPSMSAARRLYMTAGFEEVKAYYESPIEDTSFQRLKLD
ncbi:acetyltransferase, GNAT family [Polyplosphaeria fusca]|uniref:Acetyltransferase, GNAT family n=1 Tax=Polyplosphaeria fusca TaxID=682080 RepID=A0A9P4QRH9_9PLEO|nr:acetyltransferase, GNAT family [Polyplosphaeria fusca]